MIPIISVIIPVFNVEKYLRKCVDSVLAQTFKEYEILLIDDGSSDCSGVICDDYSQKYENIKVFHASNHGPSYARNVGIEKSSGIYIYFLDSDDYIIPRCLEILYTNIKNSNADLSCGSFSFSNTQLPQTDENLAKQKISRRKGEEACLSLLYGKDYNTSSCNILIKSNIAKENLFPVGKYHEDEMTTFRYFLGASFVVKTDFATYHYYQREGSIMHSFGQPVIDEREAADYYVEICKKLNRKLFKAALCKKFSLYIDIVENYPQIKNEKKNYYDQLILYLKNNIVSFILDVNVPMYIKRKALKYLR